MKPTVMLLALLALESGFAFQTFDVATIKPNAASDNRISLQFQPGGRFVATGITLRQLVAFAYDLRDFQVSGGPGWIQDDRYDINAKSESMVGDRPQIDQIRKVMQNFLAERFQLKVHQENKDMPVYELVVGKGGSKLKASEVAAGGGPRIRMGRGQLNGTGITMDMLTRQIAQNVGRNVLDKTGLKGNFDIDLTFAPEAGPGGIPASPDAIAGSGSNGPTIFTALQEQLGLKLESTKAPVATVVIDSASKPSEN